MRSLRALAVLLLLVAGLSACGSDSQDDAASDGVPSSTTSAATPEADAGEYTVSVKDFAFTPASLAVEEGETVTISNDDGATHTFTLDDGSFSSGNIAAGSSATHAFDEAGSFSYHCEIHSTMKGTITVE